MKHLKLLSIAGCGLVLFAAVLLTSCGGNDATPAPKASFTYTSDARSVTFTNTSKNAKTYAWDFGDGEVSTEMNPVHEYAAYGKYTVKLAVVGDGGAATSLPDELTLAKSSNIVIDGNLSDWDSIDTLRTSKSGEGGTITKIKVDYNADKIFFYVEGTSELRGFFDVYLDTDYDSATGYFSGWYPQGFGADYLSEGDFSGVHDADIFKDNPEGETTAWGWTVTSATGSGSIASSDVVVKGSGKGIEFSMLRSTFTNLATAGFSLAIVDVDGTVDPDVTVSWATLGALPVPSTENSKLAFVDLTK